MQTRIFWDNYLVRWYKADLHIHTVLSPCSDLTMGPKDIVQKALACNLDMIAITDHNSAQNIDGVLGAAQDTSLFVVPGMEVYSREEAHFICLFKTTKQALHFQDIIYEHLPDGENDPSWFGNQYVVDAQENILDENKKLLALPTDLHAHEIVSFVIDLDGIIYPAHIDRKANSILHALGFIPENLPFDALEIARPLDEVVRQHGFLKKSALTIIRSSDAHTIEQLGSKSTWYRMEELTFEELRKAIKKTGGRCTSLAPINE